MDILFYGEKAKQDVFLSYAEAHKLDVLVNDLIKFNFEEHLKEILTVQPGEIIIDADCIMADEKEFVGWLGRIYGTTHARIVIIAEGYSNNSRLITTLLSAGFKKIVTAATLGIAKEEYAACHEDREESIAMTESSMLAESRRAVEETTPSPATKKKGNLTISVVGAMERIGTTTTALQLAKYAALRGWKAAYLERNNTSFIRQFAEDYKGAYINDDMKMVSADGIDMFYDLSRNIKNVLLRNYDLYIYDYGVLNDGNIISALEHDEVVLVGGIKGVEMVRTFAALKQLMSGSNAFYCFNFVHSGSRSAVSDMMAGMRDKVIFLDYTPEMFLLEEKNVCELEKVYAGFLMPEREPAAEPKRRRFFGIQK